MPNRDVAERLRKRADTLRRTARSIADAKALSALNAEVEELEAKAKKLEPPASFPRRTPSSSRG